MDLFIIFVRHVNSGNRFIDTSWAKAESAQKRKGQLDDSFAVMGGHFCCSIVAGAVEDAILNEASE